MAAILRNLAGFRNYRSYGIGVCDVIRGGHKNLAAHARDAANAGDYRCFECVFSKIKGEQVDLLTEVLVGHGADSVMVTEEVQPGKPKQEIYYGRGSSLWDFCRVKAQFASKFDLASALMEIKREFSNIVVKHEIKNFAQDDWVKSVKDSYQPVQVTDSLWVVPEWCQPPDPSAVNVILEPGLAFGTGEHATTQLCLQTLTEFDLKGKNVIDYGTGSGVLSIAAILLGANNSVGVDVDTIALAAATRNAEINHVQGCFKAINSQLCFDDQDPLTMGDCKLHQFDLCIANIFAGTLIELHQRLSRYVKPKGIIILSGVLKDQVDVVIPYYEKEFINLRVKVKEQWVAIIGEKL